MPSYMLRGINAPLWDQVKAKAHGQHTQVKALIEKLLADWLRGEDEVKRAQQRQEWAWEHAAEVYRERDLLVRALSLIYPSHLMHHVGRYAANKKLVVCIHAPTGQIAWTIPPDLRELYKHLEVTANDWDGHKTIDRTARLAQLGDK